jgi:hypothetical protein
MLWPIHDHPNDYWRFTPEAFRSILKPFKFSFVGFAGEEIFPHTVVGIGFKGNTPELSEFNRKYEEWQKQNFFQVIGKNWHQQLLPPLDNEERHEQYPTPVNSEEKPEQQLISINGTSLKQMVKLLTPPLLLPILSRVYRLIKRSN